MRILSEEPRAKGRQTLVDFDKTNKSESALAHKIVCK